MVRPRAVWLVLSAPLALACTDAPSDVDLAARDDVTIELVGDALGCDSLRGTPYDTGIFLQYKETEKGRDCYRSGRFVGRIHVFTTPDAFAASQISLIVDPEYKPCGREPLRIVYGERWFVAVNDGPQATDIQDRIGGEIFSKQDRPTLVSYPLPCSGDAEPE